MKIVSYKPDEIKDVPAFFNKNLDEAANEDYIMFVFEDIWDSAIDKTALVKSYEDLMKAADLPYAFYPYYIHFNKVIPDMLGKPNPRAHVKTKSGISFDIVNQPAYGMLIIDVKKINSINFRFNPQYKISFYVQDLIHSCFAGKLWISETYYLDVVESYKFFSSSFKEGYHVPLNDFNNERNIFIKNVTPTGEPINDFIKHLKAKFNPEEAKEVEQK